MEEKEKGKVEETEVEGKVYTLLGPVYIKRVGDTEWIKLGNKSDYNMTRD